MRLDAAHRPSHAFQPGIDFNTWRDNLLRALRGLLGPLPAPADPEPVELEHTACRGYVQTKLVYRSAPDVDVPAYLLVPDGVDARHPAPAILALHGHGGGKGDLLDDGASGGIYHSFGRRFAERGYVVLATDAPGFGERGQGFRRYGGRDGCNINFLKLALFGRNLMTLAIWDDLRALDVLEARPEVLPGRIGIAGLSFGGTRAMYLAALDTRVAAVVVSGYLTTFRAYALAAGNFCGAQFLPGVYDLADVADIHGCIAPRPLLIQAGRVDRGFDIRHHGRPTRIWRPSTRQPVPPTASPATSLTGGTSFCPRRPWTSWTGGCARPEPTRTRGSRPRPNLGEASKRR